MAALIDWLAEFKNWLGNGQAYYNDLKYPVALCLVLKVQFPWLTLTQQAIIGLFLLVVVAFIGWFDLRYIKLHQRTQEIATEKYNPYYSRLVRLVRRSGKRAV